MLTACIEQWFMCLVLGTMLNCFWIGQGPCLANLYRRSLAKSAVVEYGQEQTVSVNKFWRHLQILIDMTLALTKL